MEFTPEPKLPPTRPPAQAAMNLRCFMQISVRRRLFDKKTKTEREKAYKKQTEGSHHCLSSQYTYQSLAITKRILNLPPNHKFCKDSTPGPEMMHLLNTNMSE